MEKIYSRLVKPVRQNERAFLFLHSMPKQGFKNQWIEICRIGEFVDAGGKRIVIDDKFLDAAIANFNATNHEPPIVVGHPKDDTPAFGWTRELQKNGDRLEAKFADTNDEFEKMVQDGAFRKRSSSFYLDPPVLKHVGFLGAMPPAVKGLKNIEFAEGATATFENFFNLQERKMEKEDLEQVSETLFDKIKNLFKAEETVAPLDLSENKTTAINFSEAQAKALIDEAVKTVEANFAEKLTAKDEKIQSLEDRLNAGASSSKRAEIVAFVEAIPAEKGKHFLKNAGIVEFMESLADGDKADAINFSEGDATHKFSRLDWFKNYVNAQQSFVEFGEHFGNLKTTPEAEAILDPNSLNSLRGGMGVETKNGGAK